MVNAKKKELVQRLAQEIKEYPLVGLVNMQSLPAQQLQKMRCMLRNNQVQLEMTRKKLLKRALQESGKENIQQLAEQMKGMPALIFTKGNPFALYSTLQKNKSEAPAKAGQIAPREIVVKAGPTSFVPGPIISELAAVGIKTKVDAGKLNILADTIVAKEGESISLKLAEMLKRLDIKPMEVGLDLVAVWENGLVFNAKQLHLDEAEYTHNFTQAVQWAMNLAVEVAYPAAETAELLLQRAFREAKAVAIEQNFITEETREEILAQAEAQALSLREVGKIETGVINPKEEEREAPLEERKGESSEEGREEIKEEPKPKPQLEPKEEPLAEPEPEQKEEVEEVKEEKQEPVEETSVEEKKEEVAEKEEEEKPIEQEKKEEPIEEAKKTEEEKIPPVQELVAKKEEKKEFFYAGGGPRPIRIPKDAPHPKQGSVTSKEAEDLLKKLQRVGTLRK